MNPPEQSPKFTWKMAKTILISGVGFMTDAYDLFIIGIITPMIAVVYFNGKIDPTGEGLVKGAAAWGTLCGQLGFGFLADKIGRKSLYSLVLIMITFGTLASALSGPSKAVSILGMLGFWRLFLGVGIGGDYPLSGVVTSEFAQTEVRGMMISAVFAMQGIGILLAAVISVIVVAMFKQGIESDPVLYLDYVWRICIGVGAIPGLIGVYFRLQVPESPRYVAQKDDSESELDLEMNRALNVNSKMDSKEALNIVQLEPKINHTTSFTTHFGQWKNLKILLGASVSWFALDVGFYGTNLNTPTILQVIGFGGGTTVFEQIWNICLGNLAISLLGSVPGYWFTVFFIEKMGRKPIQIMGFALLAILFAALAVGYNWLTLNSIPLFVAIYTLIQFFNNFGPNATTFVLAGEVFPTRFRTSAHGIASASGKLGAIIAAHGFSIMKNIGGENAFIPTLLGIFSAFMVIGLIFTLLLPETKGRSLESLCGEDELVGPIPDFQEHHHHHHQHKRMSTAGSTLSLPH